MSEWYADVRVNGEPVPYLVTEDGRTVQFVPDLVLREGDVLSVENPRRRVRREGE